MKTNYSKKWKPSQVLDFIAEHQEAMWDMDAVLTLDFGILMQDDVFSTVDLLVVVRDGNQTAVVKYWTDFLGTPIRERQVENHLQLSFATSDKWFHVEMRLVSL